ncbi:MAG: pantoate--beta-alanine ligase [Alphaproteobacteria bacterium]|nr:pantoate--beta-alanine ligase [Alphaproteobacteria bacterium]
MLTQQIPHATTVSALRTRVRTWREEGLSVGFVPTMGALHDGHLSLVRLAKAHTDRVVASIFVNPKQFAAGEDLDTYPRTVIDDAEKLATAKCDLIFLPDNATMYPEEFDTSVRIGGPGQGLEASERPHFFHGVATVVAKLFNQVRPDVAVFGEKDYQQLLVIKKLVKDLDFPVDIIPGEIVREADGLAMSSRNAYLDADQRQRAGELNKILQRFRDRLEAGEAHGSAQTDALEEARRIFDAVDYLEARHASNLALMTAGPINAPARLLAAVRLGETRLLDNFAVAAASSADKG